MKLYEIGPKVKELRKEKSLTQEHLANISGVSRVTIGKFERGEVTSLSIKTLDIILAALSFEIDIKSSNSGSFGLNALDAIS